MNVERFCCDIDDFLASHHRSFEPQKRKIQLVFQWLSDFYVSHQNRPLGAFPGLLSRQGAFILTSHHRRLLKSENDTIPQLIWPKTWSITASSTLMSRQSRARVEVQLPLFLRPGPLFCIFRCSKIDEILIKWSKIIKIDPLTSILGVFARRNRSRTQVIRTFSVFYVYVFWRNRTRT